MPTGRPTLCTPEVQKKILSAIRAGNYKHIAAQAAGVHRDTLNGWELRGAKGEEPFASFSDALQKAEAEAEVMLVARVHEGGEGWQSKAWICERRWAKRWAARVRQQVTEELDAFTDRLQRRLDEETYRKVLNASREDADGPRSDQSH